METRASVLQVRLYNREDVEKYQHYELEDPGGSRAVKLCRLEPEIQEVPDWKEVAHGMSITDLVGNYHICSRDVVKVNGEEMMLIGASIFEKNYMRVTVVYFLKNDFVDTDIYYLDTDQEKKRPIFKTDRFATLLRVLPFEVFQYEGREKDASLFQYSPCSATNAKFGLAGLLALKFSNTPLVEVASSMTRLVLQQAEERVSALPPYVSVADAINAGKHADIDQLHPKLPSKPPLQPKTLPVRKAGIPDRYTEIPGVKKRKHQVIATDEKGGGDGGGSGGRGRGRPSQPKPNVSPPNKGSKSEIPIATTKDVVEVFATKVVQKLKETSLTVSSPAATVANSDQEKDDQIKWFRDHTDKLTGFQQAFTMKQVAINENRIILDSHENVAKIMFGAPNVTEAQANAFERYLQLTGNSSSSK